MTGRPADRRIAESELEAREAEALDRARAADKPGGGPGRDADPDRVVSPLADADDRVIETALRPKRLADFVGQQRVRDQLSLVLESAVRRGRPPDHVLLSGPPGLGKTTIAMIIAAELGMPLRITSGPAIERSGDLAAVLSTLSEGEVVFIDEIHRLARPAEEMLYLAMEDFRVDVVVGKGPGATAIPLDIAPFTLVGATTRSGLLPAPLRDRFGFTAHLDFYQPEDLEVIIRRSAGLLGVTLRDDGAAELAGRSRGTPRIANRLLRRVRDYAEVKGDGVVEPGPGPRRARAVRGGRAGPGPAGPGRARSAGTALRRRTGRAVHAGRRRRRGGRDRRGRGRAVPGPPRPAGPDPARPGRHPGRLAAPGPRPLPRVPPAPACPPCSTKVAGRSRSRRGRRSLLVRGQWIATLRQLATGRRPLRNGLRPDRTGAWPGQPADPTGKVPRCMGSSATAAAATSSSGGSTFIILIIVFIGLIYFMAIRPGRNRQKKVVQQQNSVRPGRARAHDRGHVRHRGRRRRR